MEIIFQIGIVLLLILLNGFFVASEYALVSVRKSRIDELAQKGSKRAQLLQNALERIDKYISATQLGITLASLALGWIGEPIAARLVEPLFAFLPVQIAFLTTHAIAVATSFAIITYFEIVIGELVPKTYALSRSEQTILIMITPLLIFTQIFHPFIWFLNLSGNFILGFFGVNSRKRQEAIYSEDEIENLVRQSRKGGALEKDEADMALNAFRLGEIPVKEVMVLKSKVIAFNVGASLQEVTDVIETQLHSRYPVYKKTLDQIVGFVHVKDVLRETLDHDMSTKLSELSIIRKISHYTDYKKIDEVFHTLRRRQQHMGVVQNSKNKTIGVVYLEDIIESIVGKIEDEFDKPQ